MWQHYVYSQTMEETQIVKYKYSEFMQIASIYANCFSIMNTSSLSVPYQPKDLNSAIPVSQVLFHAINILQMNIRY